MAHFPTEPPGFCRRWPPESSGAYRRTLGTRIAPEFTAVGHAGYVGATAIGLWSLLWVAVAVAGYLGWTG